MADYITPPKDCDAIAAARGLPISTKRVFVGYGASGHAGEVFMMDDNGRLRKATAAERTTLCDRVHGFRRFLRESNASKSN